MHNLSRKIELLAPAKTGDIAIEALKHGADAVYIGASSHGARRAAANDIKEIARVVDFAHRFQAKVYVTLNTLIYENELFLVERLVKDLYRIEVDALIVQDMGLLRLDLPPIALHASTQTDIRTTEKARFMAEAGFSQIVLPREMTLSEMAKIHSAVPDVTLEAFVHGALCVSYSGDCQAGFVTSGRSANRGECPQICRRSFSLVDRNGRTLIADRHLLSLRDLNRSAQIGQMIDAGVSSFKIEGRLKDAAYVKNTVAAYRRVIDEAISERRSTVERASIGDSQINFKPDLNRSFNRGYTSYFTLSPKPVEKMASILSPKWTGLPIGTVKTTAKNYIEASLTSPLANGDGLGYFDSENRFQGFRLNRIEDNRLFPAKPLSINPGTLLYRNHDRLLEEAMSGETAKRTIKVDMTLRPVPFGIALDVSCFNGLTASATIDLPHEEAKRPQTDTRNETLRKTGDTDFSIDRIDDRCDNIFIPVSRLAALRRKSLEMLSRTIRLNHKLDLRRKEKMSAQLWAPDAQLTYHDNVANSRAVEFYRQHGANNIQQSLEVTQSLPHEIRIMTCRYCLRREMGKCRLTAAGKDWVEPLFLISGPDRFRLKFDCANCRMKVFSIK